MKLAKSLLLTTSLLATGAVAVQAQDIHYTMFDLAPMRLSAAQTGFFEGSFRIGGIFRTQWGGLSPNGSLGADSKFRGYQTPHAYIDVPFAIRGKKSSEIRHWAGIGLHFLSDKVSELSQINAQLALAYHLGLGKRGNTRLSIGVQGGIMQQRVDASGFLFEDGILAGGGTSTYQPVADNALPNDQVAYPDFSAGLLFAHRTSKFGIEANFAVNHFTQPKYNFLNETSNLPMALLGSLSVDVGLTNRLVLRPMFFYHNVRNAQDINAQLLLGIHLNQLKDITAWVGGGYRFGDSGIARIGLDLKGLRFGFAYDINANKLSIKKSNRPMGFEVALSYIVKIYKNPVIKEILFCPRF